MDFLNDLNKEQRKAVETTEGPIMVIAGAGSGKTRVLTYKVAYLIESGVEPYRILALTFTNKAAHEMKERILQLVKSQDPRNVWMGTFHSVFARILRVEGHYLGFQPNFSIYDTDDSKSLLRSINKELNLDPKQYHPSYVLGRISLAKNNLFSAADYNQNDEFQSYDADSRKPLIGKIFTIYQNRLFKASAMDFDDLLFFTNVILRDYPEALYKYQQKFKYILIDEYQDTNYSQYVILKRLAANNENICVVGDDAQSIYAFRGANIENIFNFKKDYPDHQVFKLEQNYRSTQNILGAANSVIVNNRDQIPKRLWTEKDPGPRISVIKAINDTEEGILVAHSIFETKMNYQLDGGAFAILYRTNAQSRSFEEALRRLNIPYRIYGGLSFYKRKEIKDLTSYYRLVVNPKDQEALLRVINYPARGIGQTTLEKLVVAADEANLSLWEVMMQLDHHPLGIASGTRSKIGEFITRIKSYTAQLHKMNAYELANHIAGSSGILKELKDDETPEGISRTENIEELLNAIRDFCDTARITEDGEIQENNADNFRTLDEFLNEISLLTDLDNDDKVADSSKVSLMTVHAAKGLEFHYVYIAGLEENLFPSYLSMGSRAEIEEERRLFYVALTRARQGVTLAHAENRYRWGNLTICQPSRFIDEINTAFIDIPAKLIHDPPNLKRVETIKVKKGSDSSGPAPPMPSTEEIDKIAEGMVVMHQRFGKGKVIRVEGSGPNKKATVDFPDIGQKQLLLRFARLEILK